MLEEITNSDTLGLPIHVLFLMRISISFITFSKESNDPKVLRTTDVYAVTLNILISKNFS